MGSNERLSDRDDPRLYPPLHPDYDPDEIAAKLERKQARIRVSMKAFSRHQSEATNRRAAAKKKGEEERRLAQAAAEAKRNKKPSYKDNLDGYGLLSKKGEEGVRVEHTAENDHFFRYDPSRGFLVRYHGSADIVCFLETQTPLNSIESIQDAKISDDQRLSFFNTEGVFYNNVLLLDFYENPDTPGNATKHNAVFAVPTGDTYQELPIAIDDIYCISEAAFE